MLYLTHCQYFIQKKVSELIEYKENNIQVELIRITNIEVNEVIQHDEELGQAFWHYLKKKIEDVSHAYHAFREHLNQNNDFLLLSNDTFRYTLLGSSKAEFKTELPDTVFLQLDKQNQKHYTEFLNSLMLMNNVATQSEKLQTIKEQMFIAFRKNIISTREVYLQLRNNTVYTVQNYTVTNSININGDDNIILKDISQSDINID